MNCMQKDFKGVVHPKNVIMSSHTHPLVVSNLEDENCDLLTLKLFQTCMNLFLLLNAKEDILKYIWVTKQLMDPIDI